MIFETTKRKPDYILLAAIGALVALGLVMVYSASFVDAFTQQENQFYYLFRQLTGACIGTVGMLVARRINYTVWRRYSVHLMGLALILLMLVLILPSSMTTVNDSRSWIRYGAFSFQPSEFAKLALIVYLADWLSRRGEKLNNVTYGLIPFGVMLGIVCGLVMLEPDLGTTVVLVMIAGLIYFAAGANLLHIGGAVVLAIAAFWSFIALTGKVARIQAFQDPWKYYDTSGYQPVHALYALGSGGFFGVGLGQARQKFLWLPQAHTDAIFAIIGEELGLIGTLLVLGAFVLLAYRGFRIAGRAPDPFATLVAVGITSWIVFQALLNIAVVTSLVPFTGLTLPFLSYGSSSLMMCMIAMGLLLNISQHIRDQETARQSDPFAQVVPQLQASLAAVPAWGRERWSRLWDSDNRSLPRKRRTQQRRTGRTRLR
jgi:cell division protein FtsW